MGPLHSSNKSQCHQVAAKFCERQKINVPPLSIHCMNEGRSQALQTIRSRTPTVCRSPRKSYSRVGVIPIPRLINTTSLITFEIIPMWCPVTRFYLRLLRETAGHMMKLRLHAENSMVSCADSLSPALPALRITHPVAFSGGSQKALTYCSSKLRLLQLLRTTGGA